MQKKIENEINIHIKRTRKIFHVFFCGDIYLVFGKYFKLVKKRFFV